jgi:hypothetical protein
MTEQNNTKVIMNHNGTQSYQFQRFNFLQLVITWRKHELVRLGRTSATCWIEVWSLPTLRISNLTKTHDNRQ